VAAVRIGLIHDVLVSGPGTGVHTEYDLGRTKETTAGREKKRAVDKAR
jgi:hypothetical protein